MIRKLALTAAALGMTAFALMGHGSAGASGTTLQTVSQTETIVNGHCYTTHRVTTSYYRWSKTTGWTRLAAPKVTTTNSETCH